MWLMIYGEAILHDLLNDGAEILKSFSCMKLETDINRFIEAQEIPYFCGYKHALEEVKNGKKTNHWIWYIFPQLRCLGRSSRAHFYGIADRSEAEQYLNHQILGSRIREITEAL